MPRWWLRESGLVNGQHIAAGLPDVQRRMRHDERLRGQGLHVDSNCVLMTDFPCFLHQSYDICSGCEDLFWGNI